MVNLAVIKPNVLAQRVHDDDNKVHAALERPGLLGCHPSARVANFATSQDPLLGCDPSNDALMDSTTDLLFQYPYILRAAV